MRARRFVIATGSMPSIRHPGLDEVPYFTNETIFDVSERIQHLIVLGGGRSGVACPSLSHARLHVSVFDVGSFLAHEDPDAAAVLIKRLTDTQVMLNPTRGWSASSARRKGSSAFHREQRADGAKGSHLLVATGRKTNVKSLSLERAAIAYSDAGIKVNDYLRTTNRRVYAVGDVIGGLGFTHLANYQAVL